MRVAVCDFQRSVPPEPRTPAPPLRGGVWGAAGGCRLLLLLLLALLVEGGWLLSHPPALTSGETAHWWPIVLNVAHGRGYSACFPEYFPTCRSRGQPTAAREPIPVLVFAGVARLTGDSLRAAAVLEALIHLAVTLALYLLGRELAGEAVGSLAALLWIFFLPSLKLIPQVSGELLAALGTAAGLFYFVRARRTGAWRHDAAAGLALGIASLSRSASLVMVPGLLCGLLLMRGPRLGARVRSVCLVLLACLVPLLPWALRNYRVFGEPVVGSTLQGYNLYRQNYMLPSGDYFRFVAGEEAGHAVEDLLRRQPETGGTMNEAQFDDLYRREALRIIEAWPSRYGLLSAYRFFLLWFGWGYLKAYGARPAPADYLVMAGQGLFLILAFVGLRVVGLRAWPLAASVAALVAIHMAVISQLRFLVPVMPLTLALSAVGLLALAGGREALRSQAATLR